MSRAAVYEAEVMMALGLHEAEVAEYRRWHAGGVLHATRTELRRGDPTPHEAGLE
ncbi:MAG TPA: hypothetical protein VE449_06080 [Thermoleophilaceae bacterium]|jgi:hypothetical protein|nr:hypothetical protein [Thermoleophilaceae bacterium]